MTLSAASSLPVSVTIATAPNTATADVDYDQRRTPTFAPGETLKTFQVSVFGDLLDEINIERYWAELYAPSNATLGTFAQGGIVDNDARPSVNVEDVTAVEGNSGTTTFTFDVTLSAPSSLQIIAKVRTNNGWP